MSLTLCKLGVADDEAFAFVQGTENMAGPNALAEIRGLTARLDAQNAKLAAQQREFRTQRWMLGVGFTALAILITLLALLV